MEELKLDLKRLIIDCLKLEDLTPDEIKDEDPLFGEEGLGLDSIDALELSVALEKAFGVTIPDKAVGQRVYENIASLAAYVADHSR